MPPAHRALVTAPFRGEGLDTLKELADVVLDPWIDYTPLRILDGPKLADRIKDEGADILIVESDFVNDPVFGAYSGRTGGYFPRGRVIEEEEAGPPPPAGY